jgi:glycosyltransferase involved in cell wall biosynthesis
MTAYTPHGGSLNYFPGSVPHRLYMKMEQMLERGTGLFLFESQFVCDRYAEFVGSTSKPVQVFLNGLHAHEFARIEHVPDAADLMFIGELRYAKGIDLLLQAIAAITARTGRALSINIVGSGPDEAGLRAMARQLGLSDRAQFLGAMPARIAFERGKVMVVPSRFESMPYVVLEAAGCGQPLISTKVGGIPEIFGPDSAALIEPGDIHAIEAAVEAATALDVAEMTARTDRLRHRVMQDFSAEKMTDTVVAAYRRALAFRENVSALPGRDTLGVARQ